MSFLHHFEHDMSRDLVSLFALAILPLHKSRGVKGRKCYILECCFATYIRHKLKSEKFEHLSLNKFESF